MGYDIFVTNVLFFLRVISKPFLIYLKQEKPKNHQMKTVLNNISLLFQQRRAQFVKSHPWYKHCSGILNGSPILISFSIQQSIFLQKLLHSGSKITIVKSGVKLDLFSNFTMILPSTRDIRHIHPLQLQETFPKLHLMYTGGPL